MTSRGELRKRQVALYRKVEASYAPRKKDLVQPIGNGGVVDRRLDKARTIIALIYGWMEVAEEQEKRRIEGLSWAPKEKHRDVEYAGQLLNELIEDMRRDA